MSRPAIGRDPAEEFLEAPYQDRILRLLLHEQKDEVDIVVEADIVVVTQEPPVAAQDKLDTIGLMMSRSQTPTPPSLGNQ